MNKFLNDIYLWLDANEVSLNDEKMIYITSGNYCNSVSQNFNLRIKNCKRQNVEKCKYLGIYIDHRMGASH